jgi:folate-dependent phosphoribosylglycinamide formyltransferase PurN
VKKRLVVFASGNGSNFQALVDACAREQLHAEITLLITNRRTAYAAERAAQAGIPHRYEPLRPWLQDGKERADYDAFLGAKKLWEWEHEDTLKRIGYLV